MNVDIVAVIAKTKTIICAMVTLVILTIYMEMTMSKNVYYDFSLDSIVAVDAPIGTDPDTLIEKAKQKLIQRILEDDVTIVFENIFDSETGAYDEDWENYE